MSIFRQLLGTAIVCYMNLSMGIIFTWPSSTFTLFLSPNTTLNRAMTDTEGGLLGSLSCAGALVSTPIAGYFLDSFGRKNTAIVSSLSHVIAWTLIVTYKNVEVVLTAVFISGLGGAAFLVVPVYVNEITQESIRGAMTAGSMIFYSFGMLLSYLFGGILPYQTMSYVGLSAAVLGSGLLLLMRESPISLMQRGLEKDAARSIAFYRGLKPSDKEVLKEMDSLRRALNPHLEGDDADVSPEEKKLKPQEVEAPAQNLSLKETWRFVKKSKSTQRATFVCFVLVLESVMQGIAVVQVYADPLFKQAVPNMSSTMCSVLLSSIGILAGFAAAYMTDAFGRRSLMIHASSVTGLCCIALGTQLHLHWGPDWLTVVLIYLYTVVYTFGAGTVPYILGPEVFLPEVKSIMSMLVYEWVWFIYFVILFIFAPLITWLGLGPVFYIFAVFCFMSSVFSYYFQPETKGLSVDEIQILFSKKCDKNVSQGFTNKV